MDLFQSVSLFSECCMIRGVFLLCAVVACSANAAQDVFFGKVVSVSDGDTLWVHPDVGGRPRKLRIDGIDAPEICQPGGEASRKALAAQALNRRIQVTVRRYDDYGRGLARLVLDKKDLGAHMVSTGHAWSYRWRKSRGPYSAQEDSAREAGRGIFANGQPEPPRDFRKRHGPCHAPAS